MSEFCQSRQITNIFPSDSRKPKCFTWKYTRMSPMQILSFVERSQSPKFNKEQFRWCSKGWSLLGCAPSFFPQVLEEMNWVCSPSEVEIKTADFYFLHKQRYNIYICLLIEFWCFLNFRSEPRLRRKLATSKRAMRKLRISRSPAASWGWYITAGHLGQWKMIQNMSAYGR